MIGFEHYLLVAMIGAIVLTRHEPAKAMELIDVKPGQGL